jgi:predicted nucleic acid-binding Zn ribbon protein
MAMAADWMKNKIISSAYSALRSVLSTAAKDTRMRRKSKFARVNYFWRGQKFGGLAGKNVRLAGQHPGLIRLSYAINPSGSRILR